MNYSIRELKQDGNKVLDTFLYEAIFIPEGVSAPPKDIINQPDLQVYVKDFGKNKGDLCLVAQVGHKIVGAVWVRIMNDYGHVDNETLSSAPKSMNNSNTSSSTSSGRAPGRSILLITTTGVRCCSKAFFNIACLDI